MINMVKQSLAVARLCPKDAFAARAPVATPLYENLADLAPLGPLCIVACVPAFHRPVFFTDILAHHVSVENLKIVPCSTRSNV
jgi:hypothetical protein